MEKNGQSSEDSSLILIVDDVPRNLQVLAHILSKAGHKVAGAKSAEKAMEILDNVQPDLILLDVMMPDMNGFDLCRKMKASETTREIPVIFLTAKTEAEDIVKGFQCGGVDYLTKPFNSTELLARVKTHLELRRSKQELAVKNKKIESINHHLTDSINYAQHIQQAILPRYQDLKSIFPQSFVHLKPRDIVSGDFFWASSTGNRVIIAAVDCTGHGVPGAFISILSYQLLHNAIVMHGLSEPDKILNEVHREISSVFCRENADISGGMDVAICSLDLKTRVLEFAGAHRPLIYIHDGELHHIKGDKFSIGRKCTRIKELTFTKHAIHLPNTFMCYLFSDGFPDQLGTGGRRSTRKRFMKLLQDIHQSPMDVQEGALEKGLNQWMGTEYEQIDDILVLGFRM